MSSQCLPHSGLRQGKGWSDRVPLSVSLVCVCVQFPVRASSMPCASACSIAHSEKGPASGRARVTEIQGSPTLRAEWSGKWGGKRLHVMGSGQLARVGQEGRQRLPLPSPPTPLGCRFPQRNLLCPQPLLSAGPGPLSPSAPPDHSVRLYGEWGLFSCVAILDFHPTLLPRPGQWGCF